MYKQRQTRQSIKYANKTKYHNHNKAKYTQNTKQHSSVAYYNTCSVFFLHLLPLKHYLSNCKIGVHFCQM